MTIYDVENDLINKVVNLTTNEVGNDSNGATKSDVQIQFAVDSAGISQQKLLIDRMIWIRQEEVPVSVPPTEPSITAKNQPAMAVSSGIIYMTQVLKTPVMQKFIAGYNSIQHGSEQESLVS